MAKYNLMFSGLLMAALLALANGCPQSGTEPAKSGAASSPPSVSGGGSSVPGTTSPPGSSLKQATDFTFARFNGETGKMSSYFGKPLVVNFWATW